MSDVGRSGSVCFPRLADWHSPTPTDSLLRIR